MRTLRKYSTFTNETRNEHPANTPLPPTKFATNTPTGVGANSSCPYPYIIKYVYSFHKIRAFVPSYIHFRTTFRGCIRICGHDKSAPTAANKLPKYCEQIGITQHSHNETRNEHPVRRRGRFIAPVSLHYKIHISTLLNTYICSIEHAFSYHISWVYTDMRAR